MGLSRIFTRTSPGAGLRDGLLGDGQNVCRFSVVIEANGLHLLPFVR